MNRSKKDNITVDQIVADFASPIDNYEEIEIESYEEATEYLNRIADNLLPSQSWKVRCGAIDRTIQLLKGGIQYYPEGDLQGIASLISTAIMDLRAIIVRKASLLVAIAAKLLKEDFAPSAKIIFPSLLKQVSSKSSVISNYCHCSLLEIAKYTSTKQVGLLFIKNYTSNVVFNRQVAAESCHIISETWPSKISSSLANDIVVALEKLSNDPNETVKAIANQAISISRQNSPRHKRGQSTLPVSPTTPSKNPLSPILKESPSCKEQNSSPTQKDLEIHQDQNEQNQNIFVEDYQNLFNSSIKSNQQFSQSANIENIPENQSFNQEKNLNQTQTEKNISSKKSGNKNLTLKDVLLPSTKKAAIIFKSCLDVIVQSDNMDEVTSVSEKDFITSVIYSIQQIPNINLWKEDLSALFFNFPDFFESKIIFIMANFHFDIFIYQLATSTYSTQAIAEMFVSGKRQRMSDAFRFFVTAFKTEPNQIKLDEKMKSCIQILIQSKPQHEDTHFLIDALEQLESGPSIQTVVESILLKLQNNERWGNDLHTLSKLCNGDSKLNYQVESRFKEVIPKLVTNGTEEQKQNTIHFITECSYLLKKVSFASSVDPVISIVLDQNCTWAYNAIECLGKMMFNIKVLAIVIQKLDDKDDNNIQILIEAMLVYFIDAQPHKMIAIQKILTEKLLPFISNQNPEIRKTVTQIFAEFQKKVPKEFGKILNKRFTPSQRRLIEITAQKPRPVLKQ